MAIRRCRSGGAEIASYNLHKGLQACEDVDTHYLARIGAPTQRRCRHGADEPASARRGAALLRRGVRPLPDLEPRNEELERDFVRVLRDLKPDVVHFHHFIGLGLEYLFAVRDTLPDARIVVTFHEYLSICHHHGQMVKTGAFKLCYRSSPTDCNACFPDISPARFPGARDLHQGHARARRPFRLAEPLPGRALCRLGARRRALLGDRERHRRGRDRARRALPDAKARRSRFAYFGQLTPYKGADVLIDAVTRIPDSVWGEDSILLVYGGNLERQPQAYKDKFAEIVERAGRRVRFCGAFQNHEMPNLDALGGLGGDALGLVGKLADRNPGGLLPRPADLASNLGGMAEKITDEVDGLHFRSREPGRSR